MENGECTLSTSYVYHFDGVSSASMLGNMLLFSVVLYSDKLNQHTAKSPRSDSDAILVQDGFLLVPHLPLSSKHSSCTGSTSSSPGLADIPKEDQFGPSSPSKKENESNDDGSSTSGSFPTADLVYSITT